MRILLTLAAWMILAACQGSPAHAIPQIPVAGQNPVEEETLPVHDETTEPEVLRPTPTHPTAPSLANASQVATPTKPLPTQVSPPVEVADPDNIFPCSPLAQIDPEAFAEIISNSFELPRSGRDDGHPGVDFAFYRWREYTSIDGHPVLAVFGGRVSGMGSVRLPYGNYVVIETPFDRVPAELQNSTGLAPGESLYHLYAHLQEPVPLAINAEVTCGEALGVVGTTGSSVVPHLHLETRLGPAGVNFSQMAYYDTRANQDEMAAYKYWRIEGPFRAFDPLSLFNIAR